MPDNLCLSTSCRPSMSVWNAIAPAPLVPLISDYSGRMGSGRSQICLFDSAKICTKALRRSLLSSLPGFMPPLFRFCMLGFVRFSPLPHRFIWVRMSTFVNAARLGRACLAIAPAWFSSRFNPDFSASTIRKITV